MENRIAIIGSGLAAVAACKVLIERGIKPVVMDIGHTLPQEIEERCDRLSKLIPVAWPVSDRLEMSRNDTVYGKHTPKKLAFGSDYFYGQADALFTQTGDSEIDFPPFSHAKGGFSVGWGASVLPPNQSDLTGWPIGMEDLMPSFIKTIKGLPYSAQEDGLSEIFPILKVPDISIKPTQGNKQLLKNMANAKKQNQHWVFGQSRLLVNANDCQYCGNCMSGCVYGAIYKANQDIDRFIDEGTIEYVPNANVKEIAEKPEGAVVYYIRNGHHEKMHFSKVLLAAGVVNSSAIVMRSKKLYGEKIQIKTTTGFIAPLFSYQSLSIDWPANNTMPGIFLEYQSKALGDNWIHTQISTPNELVLKKLGIEFGNSGLKTLGLKKLASHLVIAHGNMHSNLANHYELTFKQLNTHKDVFEAQRQPPEKARLAIKEAVKTFSKITRDFGCFLIKPMVKDITQSHGYHLGGSMPMRFNPKQEMETDTLGRPLGWKHTHVIDSSIFPSIPATTIGLLSMANADRIVRQITL